MTTKIDSYYTKIIKTNSGKEVLVTPATCYLVEIKKSTQYFGPSLQYGNNFIKLKHGTYEENVYFFLQTPCEQQALNGDFYFGYNSTKIIIADEKNDIDSYDGKNVCKVLAFPDNFLPDQLEILCTYFPKQHENKVTLYVELDPDSYVRDKEEIYGHFSVKFRNGYVSFYLINEQEETIKKSVKGKD